MTTNQKHISRKKVMLLLASALVLFIALFALLYSLRGVWRSNILPAYAAAQHKDKLQATLDSQVHDVNTALQPLGIVLDDPGQTACNLDIAVTWRTAIGCWAEIDSKHTKLNPLPTATTPAVIEVKNKMLALGWQGGIDESSFMMYFGKQLNGFDCSVQVIVFTSESEVLARLFCSQNYHYLGDPYKHL